MANEITLPRLGWDMVEGSLAGWLKADGDWVNSGDLLFNVEGDKAVQEIEAFDSGYLRIAPDCPVQGVKVPVGAILGYLVSKEELSDFQFPGSAPVESKASARLEPVQAAEKERAAAVVSVGAAARKYISPYARRLAGDLGVDWQAVSGSGLRGRIMAKDVQAAAAQRKVTAAVAPQPQVRPVTIQPTAPAVLTVEQRAAMSSVRRKIAENMSNSAHNTAPVTLISEVDATEMVRLRATLKKEAGGLAAPSYNDILAKICAQALMDFPALNARLDGDEIVQYSSAHISIAVDTERGLLAPIIRDVQTKSLRQVSRESLGLIDKARSGQISYDDLQGATFTITNLGMFEIDAFTPIINLPQCAILGVGRIVAKQVVLDFEKEIVGLRQLVTLSLTFDHRLNDGAGAARFLQRIRKYIENPILWLAGF